MNVFRFSLAGILCIAALTSIEQASAAPKDPAPEIETSASPKSPWGDFALDASSDSETPTPLWEKILLWVPNRVLDLVDVFRVDVGVGTSFGAVARVTKYGQVGYRSVAPLSVRVGDFGRKAPALLEHSSEMGIGPAYIESSDRKVCPSEIGLGADLFVGAYAGICVDELFDFAAGLFFIDLKKDDLH
jgi:hypothetical protein